MLMLRNRRIASKLIRLILAGITLIFALTFGYNYFLTRRIIVRNIDQSARNLSLATVNRIGFLFGVGPNAINLSPSALVLKPLTSFRPRIECGINYSRNPVFSIFSGPRLPPG